MHSTHWTPNEIILIISMYTTTEEQFILYKSRALPIPYVRRYVTYTIFSFSIMLQLSPEASKTNKSLVI